MYTGIACMADGSTVCMEGTLQECANWADNIIRAAEQEITIVIKQKGAADERK